MNRCLSVENSLRGRMSCLELLRNIGSFGHRGGPDKFEKLQNCAKSVVGRKLFSNLIKNNHVQFMARQRKEHSRDFHASCTLKSSKSGQHQQKERVKNYIFAGSILGLFLFGIYMDFAMERHQDQVLIKSSK